MEVNLELIRKIIDKKITGLLVLANGTKVSSSKIKKPYDIGYNYDNPNYFGHDPEKMMSFFYGPFYDCVYQKEQYEGHRIIDFIEDDPADYTVVK